MKDKKLNLLYIFFIIFFSSSHANKNFIIIQSTTSTSDSGFYQYIIKKFNKSFSTEVRVVAVGTGQAIRNAKKCDADILFVHHKPSELEFVKSGYGLYRKEVMYNDYVLVGPRDESAGIKKIDNIETALKKIYEFELNFVTRGDQSGTHKKELELWKRVGVSNLDIKNKWYIQTGSGMGASLNIAVNTKAYILTDRSTWISFGNKKNHKILVQNEPLLINSYGIIPINPRNCPKVKLEKSEEFIHWLTSQEGQREINLFRKDGQQLFFSSYIH